MPIKRAALRQLRKDRKRAARNAAQRSALKTIKKQWLALVTAQQFDEAATQLPDVVRQLDQAAARGLLHKNTASRLKSRLTRRLARRPSRTTGQSPAPTRAAGSPGRS